MQKLTLEALQRLVKKEISSIKRKNLKEFYTPNDSPVDEPNYHLYDDIVDYALGDRYFNFIVDYDSEDGVYEDIFMSVVETFDPDAPEDLGGPPGDVSRAVTLNQPLPKNWKFNPTSGLLECKISPLEFYTLLEQHNNVKKLDDILYHKAKEHEISQRDEV
jgi:hypothetical protein